MKSYLLSSLSHLYGSADEATFARSFVHDWLVWEPGGWKAPTSSTQVLTPVPTTPLPFTAGEALVLAVKPRRDGSPLKLGRGEECDALINDGTLSQVHLVFMRTAAKTWTVQTPTAATEASSMESSLSPESLGRW